MTMDSVEPSNGNGDRAVRPMAEEFEKLLGNEIDDLGEG